MLTKEVKTFIEILYLIIRYGPLRVVREFPDKRRKMFGYWTTLQRSYLKSGCQSARMEWHIADERRDRRFGLKLVCVLVNGGYFEHQMKC